MLIVVKTAGAQPVVDAVSDLDGIVRATITAETIEGSGLASW